jgi:predicted acylesterase/phospholipase RssA
LYGDSLDEKVLDSLLMSTALPPWTMPLKKENRYLIDGGVLSNLPIQPALHMGATEIVALDILDPRELFGAGNRFGNFLDRLTFSVLKRQVDLELELAKAQGVPVFYLELLGKEPVQLWDFQHTDELISIGYDLTQQAIAKNKDFLFPIP